MVRKLVELPMFLVFNTGTKSFRSSSVFPFLLTVVRFYTDFCICFLSYWHGVSDIFMSVFQMELNDYPHFYLADDGRLCSMGQHCPGFPRVLYDALIHLGYDGDGPVYRCRLSRVHDLDRCEISVTIPIDPVNPWSRSIIDSELDTDVEMMAHIALTSQCEDRLTTTTALPITLLPIGDQENPVWQQRLAALSDLEGPHFHTGMTSLARYTHYLFNLQHNTAWIGSSSVRVGRRTRRVPLPPPTRLRG
jgi:hypothetical protein